MTIDLIKCVVTIIRLGEMSESVSNEDLVVFSHPNYFLRDDPAIGHLYAKYEKAFVCFEFNNN